MVYVCGKDEWRGEECLGMKEGELVGGGGVIVVSLPPQCMVA